MRRDLKMSALRCKSKKIPAVGGVGIVEASVFGDDDFGVFGLNIAGKKQYSPQDLKY